MGVVLAEVQVAIAAGGYASVIAPGGIDGPLGSSPVRLSDGVTIWIDPLHPERFYRLDAFALEEGSHGLLGDLVGAGAAALIGEAADCAVWERPFEPTTTTLELAEDRWRGIARLGFLLWLEDYAVLPLDQGDFDIEIGLLAHELAPLGTEQLAGERFDRAYPKLLTRARELVADDGVDWMTDDDLVARALEIAEAAYLPDISESESAELQSLARDLSARTAAARAAGDIDFDTVFLELAGDSIQPASHAGAGGGDDETRTDTVDWNLVVRNALSTDEDTVSWRWVGSPTQRIEVRVAAAPRGLPGRAISRSLMFGVTTSSGGEYLAAGALEYSATENEYVGQCHLDHRPATGEHVQVYAVNSLRAPAGSVERDRLLGMREATRGYLDERLPDSQGRFGQTTQNVPVTRERWAHAARAFQLASQRSDDDSSQRDASRQAICNERAAALRDPAAAAAMVAELPVLSLAEKMFFRALRSA
ncbi:MAG: hypothetical protein V4479_00780 [Actinomycetota bacterium]